MVYVVLRNGKVLQYNEATQICTEDGCIVLRTKEERSYLVAKFPLDIIERAEFGRPCRVMRERKIQPHAMKY
jgi:hypothetical protein